MQQCIRGYIGNNMFLVVTFFSLLVVSWDAFPQSFVVTNARVFDGKMLYTNTDVMVRDGRIVSLGSPSISEDIPYINAAGETLLPGLIDAHAHTQEVGQLEESLRFGITTVLDMGTFPPYEIPLREAAATRADVADFRGTAPRSDQCCEDSGEQVA